MYIKTKDAESRLGIVLPIPKFIADKFIVILDEDNKLWYAKNEVVENFRTVKDFGIVFFRWDEENKISYVWYIDKPWYYNGNNFGSEIPPAEIESISFRYSQTKKWGEARYKQGGIIIVGYGEYFADDYPHKRYFLIDDLNHTYHETNDAFGKFIEKSKDFSSRKRMMLPIDGNKIKEVYETILNFNPYDVFESYTIEIEYHTQSRIGKDNYYYEYKSYSINYIDAYLEQWFKKCKSLLYKDSGYTSNFAHENPYQRFFDEENEAKSKAYAEYNRQEHFDCLMTQVYEQIQSHLLKISTSDSHSPSLDWFPEGVHIKRAYFCLNNNLSKIKNYLPYSTPNYEYLLSCAIEEFNGSE